MRLQFRLTGLLLLVLALATLVGVGAAASAAAGLPALAATPAATAETTATAEAAPVIERLTPQVISTRPHATDAFTEGLTLVDGVLYESAGLYEKSTLRREDPLTGKLLTSVSLPAKYFAEGISVVGDKVIQMTWKEGTAFIYDAATLKQVGTFTYSGEGWGMCYDGTHLYQSDGSATIYERDPATFGVIGQIDVTFQGEPLDMINELECVGDQIYANVWMTDYIIRLDKATGVIDGVIDASGLLTPAETAALGPGGVLNGIAYDSQADDFLITGKLWPKLFEVRFVTTAAE